MPATSQTSALSIPETDIKAIRLLNPDTVRQRAADPQGEENMLWRNPKPIADSFTTRAGAVKWLATQIAAVVMKTGKTPPSVKDVTDTADFIYSRYSRRPLGHFCLFFAYAQMGLRYDTEGEIEHYGAFSLQTLYADMSKSMQSMLATARAKREAAEWEARRLKMEADRKAGRFVGPEQWDKTLEQIKELGDRWCAKQGKR